jgi:hypothetical protein
MPAARRRRLTWRQRVDPIWRLAFLPLFFALVACGPGAAPRYIPPTAADIPAALLSPTPSQRAAQGTPTEQNEPVKPSPTPPCVSSLTFLEDITIPDDTVVAPGAVLDKRWRVENSGTCNWDAAYRLKMIGGDDLGAPPEQALYPARSGAQALIRIFFTAPDEAGVYRSAWQAYDPDGSGFGDPFYIEVVVGAGP